MNRASPLLLLLLIPTGAGCQGSPEAGPGPGPGPEAVRAAGTITAQDVRSRLSVIAHDSMRGRDTPSPELEETARWIADAFRSFGLEPGGDDGSYLQRYRVETAVVPDLAASRARVEGGPSLEFGTDLGFPFGPTLEGELSAGVVLLAGSAVGEGLPSGLDVAGKHVILVSESAREGAWARGARRVAGALIREGRAAGVLVATDRSDPEWSAFVARQVRRADRRLPWDAASRTPVLEIRDRALSPILEARGVSLSSLRERVGDDLRRVPLDGLTLTLSLEMQVLEEIDAPNVVGILPGSDPGLREEYLVYSAHMDHEGVGRPDATGDSIYNGADDDGSGTVTVVELAEAFASLETAPRRSMIFLLVSGEEKGLWGSDYFTTNPPVALDQVVANLNADMVGRNWPDTIVAIGRKHSDLGRTLETVAARHPELGLEPIEDPWPEESFYTRSDHYNFARRGVPILFFFSGTHEDYHRPSDEIGEIDFDKTARLGRLLFFLGLEIASRDEPPRWNPASYQEIAGGED